MKRLLLALALFLAAGFASAAVNINTATKDQLDALPGIGPVKAQAIIDYRNANGSFKSPQDVMKVRGIKEGEFGKIKDQISVSGATSMPAKTESAKAASPASSTAAAGKAERAPTTKSEAKASTTKPEAKASMTTANEDKAAKAGGETTAKAKGKEEKAAKAKEEKAAKAKAKEEKAAKAKEEKAAKAKAKEEKAAKAKEEKMAKAEAKKTGAKAKDAAGTTTAPVEDETPKK